MRIAFICNDITTRGGIERVTANLASLFVNKKQDVTVISLFQENESPSYSLDSGVKIIYLNHFSYTQLKNPLAKTISFVKNTLRIRGLHGNNNYNVIIAQATRAAIHCRLAGLQSVTIASEHFKYDLYTGWRLRLRNKIYKEFALVSVLTENDYQKFMRVGVKCIHIPNMCVNPPKSPKVQSNLWKTKTIVSLGRLHYQKGFDLLIQSIPNVVKIHPDWRFEIYGEGDEFNHLNSLIKKLNIPEYVILKGYCQDIGDVLSKASFYVLSSRYEGFPMCLLEAMSYGLPIVSFNCPEGPADLLKNNAGLLITPENIAALATGINYMIENPEESQHMVHNAFINLQEYSPQNIYNKWLKAFFIIENYHRY